MNGENTLFAKWGRMLARIPAGVLLSIQLLILFVLLAIAWRSRSTIPSVPVSDSDTWGYLNPALSWLGGLGFQQTDGRDLFYPALVAFFLKTTGSFTGLALWQKALGLLSGVLMAVAWRCWVSMLPFNRSILFLVSLCGVLPIFAQLENPQRLYFEMEIRPEAVLSFFVYAQLACLMGYCKYRWQTPKAIPSLLLGATAIFFAYSCVLLKPSWLFASAATSLPVLLGGFGNALSRRTRLLTVAAGMLLSILTLWLPIRVFAIHDAASRKFLPTALFAIHAPLIAKRLEVKLAALPDADPKKARLKALLVVLESEIHHAEMAPGSFKKLGFDPDYLFFHSPIIAAIDSYTEHDIDKFRTFCFSSYMDAAIHEPAEFAHKILSQFAYFLFPEPGIFFKDRIEFAKLYQVSSEVLERVTTPPFDATVLEMYRQYRSDLIARAGKTLEMKSKSRLGGLSKAFAPLALSLEILFMLAFVASLVWAPMRDLRLSGSTALLLFSAPLGNASTICLAHALDVARYRFTYGSYLLFALVSMAVFCAIVLAQAIISLRTKTRSS